MGFRMKSWITLILVLPLFGCISAKSKVEGINFVGQGYNVLLANPDMAPLGAKTRGKDPGYRRRVLDVTYLDDKSDWLGRLSVPDQVWFSPSKSQECEVYPRGGRTAMIYRGADYQRTLRDQAVITGVQNMPDYAFALGMNSCPRGVCPYDDKFYYQQYSKRCPTVGEVKYEFNAPRHQLSVDFVQKVCAVDAGSEAELVALIDRFGTHVVTGGTIGTTELTRKRIGARDFIAKIIREPAISRLMRPQARGTVAEVNVKDSLLNEHEDDLLSTSKADTWTSDKPEMVYLKLTPLDEILDSRSRVWKAVCSRDSHVTCCEGLGRVREAVKGVLTRSGQIKGAPVIPEDTVFSSPVTWPVGTYGLPQPSTGCPTDKSAYWRQGWVLTDTYNSASNQWSSRHHFTRSSLKRSSIKQEFCMKTTWGKTEASLPWMAGSYCVYKKWKCPPGFQSGWIQWDDHDPYWGKNDNAKSGVTPDGSVQPDTKLNFCCRKDSSPAIAIVLPTNSPFYLFPSRNECQKVVNTIVKMEYIDFATKKRWWGRANKVNVDDNGNHPKVKVSGKSLKINYCYYSPIQMTETLEMDL